MKHRTHRSLRRATTLTLLALATLLLAGCGRIAGPEGWAAPVADGDLIFVQLDRGVISAGTLSEAGNFTQRWHFPTDDDDFDLKGIYATPIVDNDVVYIAAFDGTVIALDQNNGRPIWPTTLNVDAQIVATPAFDQDHLYVATEKGQIIVVRRDIGTEANRYFEGDGRIWSRPIVTGDTLYLGEFDGRKLASIDLDTGAVIWNESLSGAISANLALAGGRVLAGGLDHKLHAYNIGSTPDEAWTFEADGWIVANPLPVADTIYIATLNGSVYAVDTATGSQQWQFNEPGLEFRSQPALIGGMLVVADRRGGLRGLDLRTGEQRWERDLGEADLFADPLILGTRLLYITRDGELIQVNPADGTVVRKKDGEA
ncbi:MAG: PQQ-binding-like beta-propeller repeat protein [Dehalococcoidia bacterium]|nr:PQQ-binding-like beta-propeller repeat protein [Dehalococcoidia bacterium]